MEFRSLSPNPKPKPILVKKSNDTKKGNVSAGWGALTSSGRELIRNKALRRGSKALRLLNQVDGIDCPGCAWPEGDDRSSFEFCENGVKAVAAETTSRRCDPEFFAKHTIAELLHQNDHWLEQQGRLTEPMVYDPTSDTYKPIAWKDAFILIGEHLNAVANPDRAVFYTSGRTSNEAAFLYQLFGRFFGTNNFPDCSNLCHESSGKAMSQAVGIGKGTVSLKDFEQADAILVVGQNPGTNHPRMLTVLQAARRRGAEVVAINPLREMALERFRHPQELRSMLIGGDTEVANHYFQPLIGGDLALVTALCKYLLEVERGQTWGDPPESRSNTVPGTVLDRAFIRDHCTGFDVLETHLDAQDWDFLVEQAGLTREEIGKLADICMKAERMIVCWGMGLTQHRHAVQCLQAIVNLLLMRGQIGKPGAGLCPVRGHSNVQGDRTMGIWEAPSEKFLDAMEDHFKTPMPRRHGYAAVNAIAAMARGEIDVFIGLGGNFAAATPDTDVTAEGLRNCKLTVQVSTKLNRSHLVHGEAALILPCLGRTERDRQAGGEQRVSVEDSMSMVHATRGRLKPISPHLKSEPDIVACMAEATLGRERIDWQHLVEDYARIRAHIEAVIPGFEDYETRLDEPGGFYLGNSARDRNWLNCGGRARFLVDEIPDLSIPEGQLRLMTTRSHDQYNTTIYGLNDRYRGIQGERKVIFMHPDDLAARGLKDGNRVDIISCFPDRERRVKDFRCVIADLPCGCAGAYFPEANPLVALDSVAKTSLTPTSKFIPVRLEPASAEASLPHE